MEYEVAKQIYFAWQAYTEVAGKLRVLKLVPPETFLPYPAKTLELGLHIWSSFLLRDGEFDQAEAIRRSVEDYLSPYLGDSPFSEQDALEGMVKSLNATMQDEQQRHQILLALASAQQKWIAFRDERISKGR